VPGYVLACGDLSKQNDEGLVCLPCLRREAWNDIAEIASVERGVLVDRTCEKATV
jgi:hypothetical protein